MKARFFQLKSSIFHTPAALLSISSVASLSLAASHRTATSTPINPHHAMSDSGSDRSRHRRRRRRTPFVAFYGPVGGNGHAAGHHYGADDYPGFGGPHFGYAHNDDHVRFVRRNPSPSPQRSSWVVEAMERLAAEITNCGYEPCKTSKVEKKRTSPGEKRSEQDKEVIDGMNAKLSKLEDAMKSVQDTLQICLERLRSGQESGVDEFDRRPSTWTPIWRQRRFDSPDRYRCYS